MSLNHRTAISRPPWLVRGIFAGLVGLLGGLLPVTPTTAVGGVESAGWGAQAYARITASVPSRTGRKTGRLKIKTKLRAHGYTGKPTFKIRYECVGKSGTVSVKATRTKTIRRVPTGRCRVGQKALRNPRGWTYYDPIYWPSKKVKVKTGKTAVVTVKNRIKRGKGSLTITKAFEDNGYVGNPTFEMGYACSGKSGTVALKSGGTTTISGVRSGDCKVTERAPSNPPGWTYTNPVYSPTQKVTVAAGKNAVVTVSNSIVRSYGSLTITKAFDANGYEGDPTFEIGYACADETSGTVSLKASGTKTVAGVPTGDCKITEKAPTNPPGWTYAAPSYGPTQTVTVVAGDTAEVTVGNSITRRSPEVDSVFSYPTVGHPDPSISNTLVGLLDQVPAGEQVLASFFIIDPTYPVVDALIRAHDRGAEVRVVLDSGDRQAPDTNAATDATFEKLGLALGKDTSAPSFAMQCEPASCISKEDGSINHNKFAAMSASGDLSDVVVQSTANMRFEGSGDTAWNAAVVSSGNAALYSSYREYFDDLAAMRSVPGNDYNAVRPPVTSGRFTPYYFPRNDDVDSVSKTLMSVDCSAAPTTVNVMASYFTRVKVHNRLNEMAQAGCTVRVIARTDHITRELCDSLSAPVQVEISDQPSVSAAGIHGKYLTISGGFDGEVNRHLVWMGSHNLTSNALRQNDETFLMIDDQSVYGAFVANFQRIWDDPTLTPGCDRAGAGDPGEAFE